MTGTSQSLFSFESGGRPVVVVFSFNSFKRVLPTFLMSFFFCVFCGVFEKWLTFLFYSFFCVGRPT